MIALCFIGISSILSRRCWCWWCYYWH